MGLGGWTVTAHLEVRTEPLPWRGLTTRLTTPMWTDDQGPDSFIAADTLKSRTTFLLSLAEESNKPGERQRIELNKA